MKGSGRWAHICCSWSSGSLKWTRGTPTWQKQHPHQTVPVGSQVGLDCMAKAHSLQDSKQPSGQPHMRPTEEQAGLSWGWHSGLPLSTALPGIWACRLTLLSGGPLLLTLLHPSCGKGSPPLCLTSMPQLLLSPLWSLWLGLGELLQGLGIQQRDRSHCGQCPGPASEAGFTQNPPNFRRASGPQKAACPPSPLTPEVGGRRVGRGRRRQGWLSQGGNPRVLGCVWVGWGQGPSISVH